MSAEGHRAGSGEPSPPLLLEAGGGEQGGPGGGSARLGHQQAERRLEGLLARARLEVQQGVRVDDARGLPGEGVQGPLVPLEAAVNVALGVQRVREERLGRALGGGREVVHLQFGPGGAATVGHARERAGKHRDVKWTGGRCA